MKNAPYTKWFFNIILLIGVFTYPFIYFLSSPDRLNSLFDDARFEFYAVDAVEKFVEKQISINNPNVDNEAVLEALDKYMLKEDGIKQLRVDSINSVYDSLDKSEVPILKLKLFNFSAEVKKTLDSFFDVKKFIQDSIVVNICNDNSVDLLCKSVNKFLKAEDISNPEELTLETLELETSLGINQDNLSTVLKYYSIVKYGVVVYPLILIVLFVIIVLSVYPETQSFKDIAVNALKTTIIGIGFWITIPMIIQYSQPFKVFSEGIQVINLSGFVAEVLKSFGFWGNIFPAITIIVSILMIGVFYIIDAYFDYDVAEKKELQGRSNVKKENTDDVYIDADNYIEEANENEE